MPDNVGSFCEFCGHPGLPCHAAVEASVRTQYHCVRPLGHSGEHVACIGIGTVGGRHQVYAWPNEADAAALEKKFHVELVLTGGMKAVCLKALCREDASVKAVDEAIEQIRALGFHDVDVNTQSVEEGR